MTKNGHLGLTVLVLFVTLLLATPSYGAITVDATTNGDCSTCATDTTSHTIGGTGDFLIVCASAEDNSQPTHTNVTDVTWNGVTITENAAGDTIFNTNNRIEIWYQDGPTTGTHDIFIDFDSFVDSHNSIISSFIGADAIDDTGAEATGSGTTSSVTATNSASDSMAVDCHSTNSSTNDLTVGSGQTQLGVDGTTGQRTLSSYEIGTGSRTMSATLGSSANWGAKTISMTATGGGGADRKVFMITQKGGRELVPSNN